MSYFNGDVVQQTYTGTEPTEFDSPTNFYIEWCYFRLVLYADVYESW